MVLKSLIRVIDEDFPFDFKIGAPVHHSHNNTREGDSISRRLTSYMSNIDSIGDATNGMKISDKFL